MQNKEVAVFACAALLSATLYVSFWGFVVWAIYSVVMAVTGG